MLLLAPGECQCCDGDTCETRRYARGNVLTSWYVRLVEGELVTATTMTFACISEFAREAGRM